MPTSRGLAMRHNDITQWHYTMTFHNDITQWHYTMTFQRTPTVSSTDFLCSWLQRIEDLFDSGPQDIEWGISQVSFQWENPDFLISNPDFLLKQCWISNKMQGVLHLLQSRPITNLPPPPLTDVVWTPAYSNSNININANFSLDVPLKM